MKTVLALALVAFGAAGYAQPPGERGAAQDPRDPRDQSDRRDRGVRKERMVEALKLSRATAAEIEKLNVEEEKSRIALRARLAAAAVDFRSLMRADSPDETLAMAKQKEISSIRSELSAGRLSHRLAVGRLLTPEQRKAMKEFARGRTGIDREGRGPMKRHREFRRHRMEPGGRGGLFRR